VRDAKSEWIFLVSQNCHQQKKKEARPSSGLGTSLLTLMDVSTVILARAKRTPPTNEQFTHVLFSVNLPGPMEKVCLQLNLLLKYLCKEAKYAKVFADKDVIERRQHLLTYAYEILSA
jgi:hypothetical protein